MHGTEPQVKGRIGVWVESLPVSIRHATMLLPDELLSQGPVFYGNGSGVVRVPYVGDAEAHRLPGHWQIRSTGGRAHVEVLPLTSGVCELVAVVEAPAGWRRRLWPAKRLEQMARRFASQAVARMTERAEAAGIATPQPPKGRRPARGLQQRRAG